MDPENPERSAAVIQMSKAFTSKAKYFYYPFAFVLPTGECVMGIGHPAAAPD